MEGVSKIVLQLGGSKVSNFESIEEPDVDVGFQEELMDGDMQGDQEPSYKPIKLVYVLKKGGGDPNFESVKDATLEIDYLDGRKVTYTGVKTLKVGYTKHQRGKLARLTLEFGALWRNVK